MSRWEVLTLGEPEDAYEMRASRHTIPCSFQASRDRESCCQEWLSLVLWALHARGFRRDLFRMHWMLLLDPTLHLNLGLHRPQSGKLPSQGQHQINIKLTEA